MTYLLYQDELGWKVARLDGRLIRSDGQSDNLVGRYKSGKSALGVLICAGVEWEVYF